MLGYLCEDCGEVIWPASTAGELRWLRDRRHIVKEVAAHLHSGLDSWMSEGLEFLEQHSDHSITFCEK